MAVDTAAKRASALKYGQVWGFGVVPSGTVDQQERQSALWAYSGILASSATVETDTDQSGVVQIGPQAWRYTWSGTSPYRLYVPGWQIGAPTTDNSIILESDDIYEPPPLEVLDSLDTVDALDIQNPCTITLQWRGDLSHNYYSIEENVSGAWVRQRFVKEVGQGYYEFMSEVLDDATAANWRIVAYDSEENAGRSMEFTVTVVRNPAPPQVHITYNPVTGNATVSAR